MDRNSQKSPYNLFEQKVSRQKAIAYCRERKIPRQRVRAYGLSKKF